MYHMGEEDIISRDMSRFQKAKRTERARSLNFIVCALFYCFRLLRFIFNHFSLETFKFKNLKKHSYFYGLEVFKSNISWAR